MFDSTMKSAHTPKCTVCVLKNVFRITKTILISKVHPSRKLAWPTRTQISTKLWRLEKRNFEEGPKQYLGRKGFKKFGNGRKFDKNVPKIFKGCMWRGFSLLLTVPW